MKKLPIGILCSAAAIAMAAPAIAASSDYLLVIDGVDGESSQAIEVQSWSWGASNPSAVSSGAPGRGSPTPSEHTVKSPRDTASGQASGRRGVNVAAGDVNGDGRADLERVAKLDSVSEFTITLAPGDGTQKMCASGKHFAKVHLVARGAVFDLEDVMISSCTGGSTLAITGRMKDYHGGHVTLIK